jgi:enoyl-[acyl-carrier-protein] reductase (NADH)
MLQSKVVVVSGVGPGLGLEVARLCLRDGARVAIGERSAERLQAAAAQLDTQGTRAVAVPADVTKLADCERRAAAAVARVGRLDTSTPFRCWRFSTTSGAKGATAAAVSMANRPHQSDRLLNYRNSARR